MLGGHPSDAFERLVNTRATSRDGCNQAREHLLEFVDTVGPTGGPPRPGQPSSAPGSDLEAAVVAAGGS